MVFQGWHNPPMGTLSHTTPGYSPPVPTPPPLDSTNMPAPLTPPVASQVLLELVL